MGVPIRVWVIHWLLVQIPATLAMRFGVPNDPPSPPYGEMPPTLAGLAHWIVEPLRNWDGLWYRLIALEGYGGGTESAKAAFWPLLPGTMRGGNSSPAGPSILSAISWPTLPSWVRCWSTG